PVRRPIRGNIGTVAPDAADLLAADRLPDVLAVPDLLAGPENAPVVGDDALGDRRRQSVHRRALVAENRERPDDAADQNKPKKPVLHVFLENARLREALSIGAASFASPRLPFERARWTGVRVSGACPANTLNSCRNHEHDRDRHVPVDRPRTD